MTESTASDAGAGICGCEDVCDLPTEALQDRLAMIRREILPLATHREALSDGMAFEFKHAPAIQKTLEDFAEFERECCSGLTWNVRAIRGRCCGSASRGCHRPRISFGSSIVQERQPLRGSSSG